MWVLLQNELGDRRGCLIYPYHEIRRTVWMIDLSAARAMSGNKLVLSNAPAPVVLSLDGLGEEAAHRLDGIAHRGGVDHQSGKGELEKQPDAHDAPADGPAVFAEQDGQAEEGCDTKQAAEDVGELFHLWGKVVNHLSIAVAGARLFSA